MASSNGNRKKGKGGGIFMLLAICLPLAFFLKSTFVFCILALMPTLVAYYVDTSKDKLLFRVVSLCNFAATLPFAVNLVIHDSSASMFQQYFTDVKVWFMVYAAAAAGWLMVKYLPQAVFQWMQFLNNQKIASIEKVQQRLIQEWGPDIQREE